MKIYFAYSGVGGHKIKTIPGRVLGSFHYDKKEISELKKENNNEILSRKFCNKRISKNNGYG